MQLKHIGITATVAAATLMAASALVATGVLVAGNPSEEAASAGVLRVVAQESSKDSGDDRAGRFDPYTQGHRWGRFDPYTEGMGHPVVDLVWIDRNT